MARHTGPIEELIISYNELNSSRIEELDEEPSALEFMRFVSRNTPFVIRGAASEWQAVKLFNPNYLRGVMGEQLVRVAVTPKGWVQLILAISLPEHANSHERDKEEEMLTS
jgi:peptidyl-lysine (3S)-dioxygenase / protease